MSDQFVPPGTPSGDAANLPPPPPPPPQPGDVAPAPGWWKASDGNWYPPQPPPGSPAGWSTGTPPGAGYPMGTGPVGYGYVPQKQSNGLAIAALVVGIVGVLFGFIPFTFILARILGALALVFGFVGLSRAKRVFTGKGMALAGVILGGLAVVLGIVGVAIVASSVDHLKDQFGPALASDSSLEVNSCTVDSFGFATASGTIT